jgi:hypothetical protein
MREALEESGMAPEQVQQFWQYVMRAAHFLVNSEDEDRTEDPRSSTSHQTGQAPTGSAPAGLLPLHQDRSAPAG